MHDFSRLNIIDSLTYLGSLIKLVRSVSSFSNMFLSLGVLFMVFLMNSSRFVPDESLYEDLSRLESALKFTYSYNNLHLYIFF